MDLIGLTIHELLDLLAAKKVSAVEATRAYLDRTAKVESRIRAYLTVTQGGALAQAEAVDEARKAGERLGPLAGVPLALKDVLCTRGVRTTCASKILEPCVPPYDATVVSRLRAAGAVFLGKANMDEFAMGSSTENSGFQPTANPWDTGTVPGGSSGGSAAAVAADEAAGALGSDTGGSIRQPASLCGIVGLKPTYGAVSRFGLVAFASSLDQIGPLTKDVEDTALLLQVIAGRDPRDSTSADVPVPNYRAALREPVRGLRVGIPDEYFIEGMDPEVEGAVREAMRVLEGLGARQEKVSLPHTDYAV
ncbi:MAG: Asp-tRNA(Asn)/Glu-tRNA(Gln) amidotransferase subunit GatA, partial [candidate division NC10 bacterium]|nr:Asp-tRNA(Asn)/Glu-tRNA(Gln) amidotransferase subunit GatA [candidate division NC10 bacterium]